jgi:uncharacterized metal-binding protein YceD (DUF177 family)
MNNFKQYDIVFTGLKIGLHQFDYKIDETFFNEYLTDEINKALVDVHVQLDKRENMLELEISAKGKMIFPCDRCLDDTEIDVKVAKEKVYVKFGEEAVELTEDLIIIKNDDYKFNIADTLYDIIMVSLPMQKKHPKISQCNQEVVSKIKKTDKNQHPDIDPRWEALNKLK